MSVSQVLVLHFIFYNSHVSYCPEAGAVLMERGARHLVRPLLSRAERSTGTPYAMQAICSVSLFIEVV